MKEGFFHGLKEKVVVSEEEAARRFAVCLTCPFFHPKAETCKKCGCLMRLKTRLAKATCPYEKW
mgnify:CR=1 FL=1